MFATSTRPTSAAPVMPELEHDDAEALIASLVGRTITSLGVDDGDLIICLDDGRDLIIYTDEDADMDLMIIERDVKPEQ